ncbi:MAG TPA: hemolysin III family protein [Sulfuricaulis sp.]|jgi:hemolysin III|nr:hemolysin III family protein [Sulfuricaulis sp.]
MTIQNIPSQYNPAEETIHAASHGAGLLLSVAGLGWMLDLSIGVSDPWRIIASSIYGASLITLFLTSTLYHGLHTSPHRHLFKLLDHCAIYLVIAGTSTPFLIVAMRINTGWWLFGAMWVLAAIGILSKIWHGHQYPRLSLASYLLMGWLMVIVVPEMIDVIGANGMAWVVAGGLCYTVGAGFYAAKKMYFHHVIWHFFVLVGAACHFLAVVWYVLPV